jgi:hypothetical protein
MMLNTNLTVPRILVGLLAGVEMAEVVHLGTTTSAQQYESVLLALLL